MQGDFEMEFLNQIALFLGHTVLIFLALLFLSFFVEYQNDSRAFKFSMFDFGIVYARDDSTQKLLNQCRKSQGRKLFVSAPEWFNQYVWNIGGVK
jgi:hypothetical protein